VPLIDDLPEIVRNELPEMDFNSHMFSSDPRFRTVMINGKSLRENDLVDTRTRVMKITEVGVILQFDELRFRVAVLDGWGQ
jgi:general secretion pathway protein B